MWLLLPLLLLRLPRLPTATTLPCRMPPVHPQIRARHVRAGVTEEEDRCAAIFLWSAEAVEHVLRRPVRAALGVEAEELFDHGGDNVAW